MPTVSRFYAVRYQAPDLPDVYLRLEFESDGRTVMDRQFESDLQRATHWLNRDQADDYAREFWTGPLPVYGRPGLVELQYKQQLVVVAG